MIVLVLVRVAAVAVNAEVAFIPPPQATSNAGIKASAVIRIGVVRRIPPPQGEPKGARVIVGAILGITRIERSCRQPISSRITIAARHPLRGRASSIGVQ
jgi:NAD(P)H-hydrate repair Nnr-like enzyme with NAD(P)H-hydrate epimerase domain